MQAPTQEPAAATQQIKKGCCPLQFITSLISPLRQYSAPLGKVPLTEVDWSSPAFGNSLNVDVQHQRGKHTSVLPLNPAEQRP